MALTLKAVVSQIEQYGASNCADLAALLGVSNEVMLSFLTASVDSGELIFVNGLYAESGKRPQRKPVAQQRKPEFVQRKPQQNAVLVQQKPSTVQQREPLNAPPAKPIAKIPSHMMELIVPTPEYLNLELRRLRSEVRRVEALQKAVNGTMRQLAKGGC